MSKALLEALEIPQYLRREPKTEPAKVYSHGNLQNPTCIFVFQSVIDKPDWALPEWDLLQKIMKAVKLAENELAFYWSCQPFILSAQHSTERGIIFGENWPGWVPSTFIRTVNLPRLMQDIAEKRLLWEKLKQW